MQVEGAKGSIGLQLTELVYEAVNQVSEDTDRQKQAKAQRIYAKAQSGQKLTPEEKSFLAKYNPMLYAKVLRAEAMRRALETRLKSCKTKEEAMAAYTAAFQSVSQEDPDRELLLNTIQEVWREVMEKGKFENLDKSEDAQPQYELHVNETGYQQMYVAEEKEDFRMKV